MYLRKGKTRETSYVFWIIVAIFSGVFVSSMAANGALEIYSYLKSGDFKSGNNLVYSYKSQAIGALKSGFAAVGESTDSTRNAIKDIKSSLGIIAMADYENGKNISKGKFIKADLGEMRLSLFEDGEKVKDFDILAKGKEGSPWETPSGQYSILSKEENHLSSIGLVWMPYSMQFFGNFFIHGWPINMDGTDVPEGYSGGCIRLSREDAGEVFKFAEINTPINIIGGGDNADSFSGKYYNLRSGKGRLNISAKAYLAADMESGEILLSENKDDVLPIASITKLVTALVSLDVINQYKEIVVPSEAMEVPYSEVGNLAVGEKIMAGDLIYPMLIESSNAAAETLARYYGRSSFINQMNNRMAAIGANNTVFDDPSGISSGNTSTAVDLFKIMKHLHENRKYILDITKKTRHNVGKREWKNNNPFAGLSEHLGGKTGYTNAAGQTMVSLFSLPLSEFGSRNIVVVTLGSQDRESDNTKMVDYLKKNVYFGVKAD